MIRKFTRKFKRSRLGQEHHELLPHEVLLDSRNAPQFDVNQFEGKIEKTISRTSLTYLASFFLLVGLLFTGKVWSLEIAHGDAYAQKAENNRLKHSNVFADRGLIYDRNGTLLAWNEPAPEASSTASSSEEFSRRAYIENPGFGHLLGYVSYPKRDSKGVYYDEKLQGKAGIEAFEDQDLQGQNGLKITETDAVGHVVSESVLEPAKAGKALTLSIDSRVQSEMYREMTDLAHQVGFQGGAGVLMDIHTGEVIAMTSFPEYEPEVMSDGKDKAAIQGYLTNSNNPFLDRVVDGLYTPGSIVKPYIAVGALEEHVIDPNKVLYTTGSIKVPNKYDPAHPGVFNDWKNQGPITMRDAIAWSSDVYFYEVGGGFGDQPGLGIDRLEKWVKQFGFGQALTGFFATKPGTIPDPAWKEKAFPGDPWRIGDTYFSSIGQYGWQVAPMQAVRAVAALANGGTVIEPTIFKSDAPAKGVKIPASPSSLQVAREGMREGVEKGVAAGLNAPYVKIATKTGTAELGTTKSLVNSWNTGFFPYDNPRFAYAIIMEKGSRSNTIGALFAARRLFDWMSINTPEYFK